MFHLLKVTHHPPKPPVEREAPVDALRGLALLFILLVNMEFYAQPIDVGWSQYAAPYDRAATFLLTAVFQLKSYLLFALLFGYSLTLQIRSADEGGRRFLRPYLRRLAGLFALGVLHGTLFFVGDILMIYAILGLGLLPARRLSDRGLLRLAVAALTFGLLVSSALLLAPTGGEPIRDVAQIEQVYRSGSFAAMFDQRLDDLVLAQAFNALFQGPTAFAFFAFGMLAGRRGILRDLASSQALCRRLVTVCLPIGLAGGILAATLASGIAESRTATIGFLIQCLAAPASSAGYAGAFGILALRVPALVRWFAPIGRLSLTVYLTESIVCSTIFLSYGGGFYGRIGPAAGIALAVALFALLMPLDRLWLRHFRQGPFEWVLRTVTTGRAQPLRRPREVG